MLGTSRGNLRYLNRIRRLRTVGGPQLVLACLFGIGTFVAAIEPSERVNAHDL